MQRMMTFTLFPKILPEPRMSYCDTREWHPQSFIADKNGGRVIRIGDESREIQKGQQQLVIKDIMVRRIHTWIIPLMTRENRRWLRVYLGSQEKNVIVYWRTMTTMITVVKSVRWPGKRTIGPSLWERSSLTVALPSHDKVLMVDVTT